MIVVAMGGYSAEREVSLASGEAVYASLHRQGIPCEKFDYSGSNSNELLALSPTLVFIALHGRGGEDGELQAILDTYDIAYTGSSAEAAQTTMNKGTTQALLLKHQLPVSKSVVLHKDSINSYQQSIKNLRPPFAVKPVLEGSSIGISKSWVAQLPKALELAYKYDDEALIEEWITGRELTVPLIEIAGTLSTLSTIEINTGHEFYDYEAKYESNSTQYICPAPLEKTVEDSLHHFAKQAFTLLGCKGLARVDFLLEETTQNIYILEINTIPGMTSHSLVPMAAKEVGMSFDDLVKAIIISGGYKC